MPLQFPVLFGGISNTRTSGKRKMSGPLINLNPPVSTHSTSRYRLSHDPVVEHGEMMTKIIITDPTDVHTLPNKRTSSTTVHHHPIPPYQTLFSTVNLGEITRFLLWCSVIVATVGAAVINWVCFFKWVIEPIETQERIRNGTIWSIITILFLYLRATWRSFSSPCIRSLADHAEIFVSVSLVMVFSTNIAFFLHQPSTIPLRDLGFMLIPPQDDHSPWRPLSDFMTAFLPIVFLIQSLWMTRENRCRLISSFFRIASIAYGLRTLTVSLTSLPGPAPHCRPGYAQYHPPQTWIDVLTRVGPMYGSFLSCGDLIFSGHMAYTNTAMLLYLRTMDQYYIRFSKVRWWIGESYLLILAILCISGRKHYSVDIILGWMISTLVYFHWEYSWFPIWWSHPTVFKQFYIDEKRKKSSFISYYEEEERKRIHKIIVEDIESIELLYPPEEEEDDEREDQGDGHRQPRADFIC